MSLCNCPEGPRCEAYNGTCDKRADWTCMVPLTWKAPPLRLGPKFFCQGCLGRFCTAWRTPMKGIDRPEGADEDWRPSIMDHIRHAQIAMAFEERNNRPAQADHGLWRSGDEKYTPAQLAQVFVVRRTAAEWRRVRG